MIFRCDSICINGSVSESLKLLKKTASDTELDTKIKHLNVTFSPGLAREELDTRPRNSEVVALNLNPKINV